MAQNEAQTKVLDHISKSVDGTYNYQVDIVNATRKKLRQCIEVVDDREKALQADPEPSDEEYVSLVVKLSSMMELVSKKYEVLATDDEVKSALDRLNESTRPPAKLGPSPRFVEQLPATRRLRAKVAAAVVPLDSIGGVPEVRVTLNDSLKEDMVVEGGAPYVCITAAVAEKLGLQLGAADKIVRLPAGDGKTADAHIVVLKSVRVGDFTVENVPCAIQPTSIKTAKNVLGGSFLRHFIYRMDLPAGAFRISPFEGPAGNAVKASGTAADSSGELPAVPTAP